MILAPPISLEAICADMHRYAARSVVPLRLPSCGDIDEEGYFLVVSEDGRRYRLMDREKADLTVEADSRDAEKVLEAVFVEATQGLARPAPGLQAAENPLEMHITAAEMRAAALELANIEIAVQERVLGQINPAWRRRQARKNALRLKDIKDLFK